MQASDWAGRIGDSWADEWRRTDRTFAPLDLDLVASAADRVRAVAAPRILDVGCGAGTTSLALADRLPAALLTGIDLSPALVSTAQERARAQPRCQFEVADASRWDRAGGFDLIVSRHGVMFFEDPVAALTHIRTRAKAGAPLVFSCFRAPALNPWASGLARLIPAASPADPHAPGPFAFADRARVTGLLSDAGWRDIEVVTIDYAYVAGAGEDPVAEAVDFFQRIGPAASALRQADGADRLALLAALRELVQAHLVDGQAVFPAAAWIWSARA